MTTNGAEGMTTVEKRIAAAPDEVFDVLADGWLFPVWVVGATHMREVDAGWPSPGTRLHHQVGPWPLSISDTTQVLEGDPPRRLVLQARGYPFGQVRIVLTVEPDPGGSLVRMAEAPTHGLVKYLDNPLLRALLTWRNRECLNRLADIAEHRDAEHREGAVASQR